MPQRQIRPQLRGGYPSENGRQSASGASTASGESSTAAESIFDGEKRYPPLRPQSQPLPDQPHTTDAVPQSLGNIPMDHNALAEIHRYNNSQGTFVDTQMTQGNDSRPASSYNGPMQHHRMSAASEGPPDHTLTVFNNHQNSSATFGHVAHASTDGEKRALKNPNATAANEKELRELIDTNQNRSLESIARDVRNAERTQKAERAKQLFAMRWLREFCKTDKESVPRNRVYTHYAQRCGTDRVDTLNPASFGKLVRVIFPGIQTRRLGVRGESKYHYVNLSLQEDPHAILARPPSAHNSANFVDRAMSHEPENEMSALSMRLAVDSATFPAQEQTFEQPSSLHETNPSSRGRLFAHPDIPGLQHDNDGPKMYSQNLRFSPAIDPSMQDDSMTLPSIYQFIPPKTDHDLADALTALYRTHCTSLIDSVRYVKEKQFNRLLGSFGGTLTVPVSRLFSHPNMAPWIKLCDWQMYQQIVRFVSQLALQVIPIQVFNMLGNVSNGLTRQIVKNFSNYPDHVLQAKLEPATIFSSLLQRLLRVNETAHAAANLLINDQLRSTMWQDWVRSVRPKKVAESALAECGHEEVYQILTTDVRRLLGPLERTDFMEVGTDFQFSSMAEDPDGHSTNTTAEGILDRWAMFLKSLSSRFPQARTRVLLQCIDAVGSASLRDLTVSQASSFGAWWITKVWVDEMMLWLAEMGGFLEPREVEAMQASEHHSGHASSFLDSGHDQSTNNHDHNPSAGLGIDFQNLPDFGPPPQQGQRHSTEPPPASFKFSTKGLSKPPMMSFNIHEDDPDDSGIGMSLLGPDMSHPSYDFTGMHENGTENNLMVH